MSSLRKKLLIGSLFILLLIGIPAVVFLSQQQQETRSRASASTTLSFAPTSSASSPIQKGVNVPVSFDVMINPGNNLPSFVKLQITYDATKLQPTATPFIVNDSAFPVTQEGPIISSNSILISVNVGNDYSRAIKQITKVGTVYFTTVAPTTTASAISFAAQSQVLSVSSSDESNENVLSTTSPAYVFISNPPTSTPTLTPTPTPIRKAGDGGNAGKGGGICGSLGSNGSIGNTTTGGTGGTGGTGCSGVGSTNIAGVGGLGGLGSNNGAGLAGENGKPGSGTGAGGGGGGGGGGAPGQPGGRGGNGGTGCNGVAGQQGLPGEAAPNAFTGGKGGRGGDGGPECSPTQPPTVPPTPTPTRTPTPVPPTPTRTPTLTPTPVTQTPTKLSITVFLHGIGNSGDSANPSAYSLSNKNPLNKNKVAAVEIINATNQPIATGSGTITYDTTSGNFKGIVDMGLIIPSSGTYNVKVKEPTHLRSNAVLHNIVIGQTNIIPAVTLVAGDINNDYYLNILDYNMLVGCYSDLAPAKSCTATNKPLADINDNGSVNQQDYNLMLREFSNQGG